MSNAIVRVELMYSKTEAHCELQPAWEHNTRTINRVSRPANDSLSLSVSALSFHIFFLRSHRVLSSHKSRHSLGKHFRTVQFSFQLSCRCTCRFELLKENKNSYQIEESEKCEKNLSKTPDKPGKDHIDNLSSASKSQSSVKSIKVSASSCPENLCKCDAT